MHERWLWDGRPIAGKHVGIFCYHGLGDTIQFIRYAPQVKRVAREVTVLAADELLPLLRTVHGIDLLAPIANTAPAWPIDVAVEAMELPHLFRTTLQTIPRAVPYLHVERAHLSQNARSHLNVGLVWRGGTEWDPRRNIDPDELQSLNRVRNVRLHILQQTDACAEMPARLGVIAQRSNLVELAQLMRALDLVISVDSMPAHLAGALGVRVWTLLHADADWRWLEQRNDSPWYPTMRLFRQRVAGDWSNVIAEVAMALEELRPKRVPQVQRSQNVCCGPVTD